LTLKQKIFAGGLVLSAGVLGVLWSDSAAKVTASRGRNLTNPTVVAAGFAGSQPQVEERQPKLRELTANLPLSFEQNPGQWGSRTKFSARGAGYNLLLTSNGAVLELRKSKSRSIKTTGETPPETSLVRLGLNLQGANRNAHVEGVDQLPGHLNYFLGNDRAKWRTDVPTFRAVRYDEVYPGISLTYYGNQRQLEYDFVIEPGADAAINAAPSGRIAVIATEGTVRGGAYVRAIHARSPKAIVTQQACPLFVALAEEGLTEGVIAELTAKRYLDPIIGSLGARPECLVLGCTHFPALKTVIARIAGADVRLVDSAETTAEAVGLLLKQRNLACKTPAQPKTRFLATDSPERFARVGEIFLGAKIPPEAVELVDLQRL